MNHIEFKIIPSDDYERLYEYMLRDFPQPGELAPFHAIRRNLESGRYEGFYLYADIEIGYMVVTSADDSGLVFGNYFAVHPELRSKGFGRVFLNSVIEKYRGHSFVIEVSDPAAQKSPELRDEALKRIRFYESAGFIIAPTVKCKIYGADMLVMTTNIYESFSAREAMLSLYNHSSASDNIDIVDI